MRYNDFGDGFRGTTASFPRSGTAKRSPPSEHHLPKDSSPPQPPGRRELTRDRDGRTTNQRINATFVGWQEEPSCTSRGPSTRCAPAACCSRQSAHLLHPGRPFASPPRFSLDGYVGDQSTREHEKRNGRRGQPAGTIRPTSHLSLELVERLGMARRRHAGRRRPAVHAQVDA